MIFPYCLPATNLSCDLPDLPWTIFQLQQGPGTNVFIVRGSRFLRTFHAQPGNCQPLPSQYCGKWCKHIHIYHWVIYNIIILNILLYIYTPIWKYQKVISCFYLKLTFQVLDCVDIHLSVAFSVSSGFGRVQPCVLKLPVYITTLVMDWTKSVDLKKWYDLKKKSWVVCVNYCVQDNRCL